MSFSFADDVSSICAHKLIKKLKKLKGLSMSAISHITNSHGETFKFIMMNRNINNAYAANLYNSLIVLYPVINDVNRKKLNLELDKAITLAEDNLPMEVK